MRILQLGKFYPIRGGVEKVMWDLARGLNAKCVPCDMLCAVLEENLDMLSDRRKGMAIDFNDRGTCYCVPARRKVAATMISPAMIARLRRNCAVYDVIHIHHPDPMACLALRLSGYKGKVILHWHSDIVKQQGLLKFYLPLQKWLIRRADLIVGTTPVYVDQSPYLRDVKDKITYLPIGIEDNIRTVQATPDPGHVKIVMSLGRLVGYKGFGCLIDAAALLPDGYKVIIAGGGELRQELEDRIDDLDLRKKVELAGYVSDEKAAELYNACDVFVLSSVMKTEAFGIVQIEAMSCGKPVVATRIPGSGTSWVNEHGVSGLNVPVSDPKALAEAIVSICSDEKRHAEYCSSARARFEKLFTYDAMIDGAIALYRKVLGQS